MSTTLPAPVLAVVGAGDTVKQELEQAFERFRENGFQGLINELPTKVQARITELQSELDYEALKAKLTVDELKGKLSKEGLQEATAPAVERVNGLYSTLTERGDSAVERLNDQPRIKTAIERVEETAKKFAGIIGVEFGELVDEVEDAAGDAASAVKKTAKKAEAAADRLEPRSRPPPRRPRPASRRPPLRLRRPSRRPPPLPRSDLRAHALDTRRPRTESVRGRRRSPVVVSDTSGAHRDRSWWTLSPCRSPPPRPRAAPPCRPV